MIFGHALKSRLAVVIFLSSGRVVRASRVHPFEAAADTFFTALVFTDADPTVDAAHLLGRIQGRELAERETPAEDAVLRVARARGGLEGVGLEGVGLEQAEELT